MRAPTPPASNETAQYADEEDNTRDRYPRRLRGTLPENRRWWVPGLQHAWDTWKEIHTGWKSIFVGTLAVTSALSCMDGGGGGSGSMRYLRQWGPEQPARVP